MAFPVASSVSVPRLMCVPLGEPMLNVTIPPGVGPGGTGGEGETPAVSATGKPTTDGLGHDVNAVEDFLPDATICSRIEEFESAKLPSLFVKSAVMGCAPAAA